VTDRPRAPPQAQKTSSERDICAILIVREAVGYMMLETVHDWHRSLSTRRKRLDGSLLGFNKCAAALLASMR